MRERCLWVMAFCLLAAAPFSLHGGAEDEASEARAVIDRAVKAAGGEEKLAARKAQTLKAKVTIAACGMEATFSGDLSLSDLGKFRCEGDWAGAMVVGVLNAEGCWRQYGGQVEAARGDVVPSLRKTLFALRAAQLLSPLKDKDVTLTHGGESQTGSRPAVVIKALHKDHGTVDLYFDKETGLPAKLETRVIFGPENREVPFECVLSDYKEFDGAKHFTKLTFTTEVAMGMQISVAVTISEVKTPQTLGDDLFAQPQ